MSRAPHLRLDLDLGDCLGAVLREADSFRPVPLGGFVVLAPTHDRRRWLCQAVVHDLVE